MDKKVILMAIIVVCVSALVYIAVSGEQTIDKPPPLPVRGGANSNMPDGHPSVGGSEMRKIAPDFELMALDGKKYKLSEMKGKALIINFWSASCGPCIMEMPTFTELANKMAGKDFEIISITSDSHQTAAKAVKNYGITIPVLIDTEGRTPQKYGVYYTPETFIIAPDGTIDQKIAGAVNWGDDSVVTYLDDLLASFTKKEENSTDKPVETKKEEIPTKDVKSP